MIKVLKRDQKLVEVFLDEYKNIAGANFEVKQWVDDVIRDKQAVEAIAVDSSTDTSLAIEHTLLQPFEGEKDDTQRFLTVIGDLEKDDSLKVPRYMITLHLNVGAIPKGIKWPDVNKTLDQWIRDNNTKFPDGDSKAEVDNNGLKIEIGISKMPLEHHEKGMLLFARYLPPPSLAEVIRTSFKKKLPKLVATKVDKRILLFEENTAILGTADIHEAIRNLSAEFAELKSVDEIWLLWTMVWDTENYLSFTRIWPDIKTSVNGHLQ
ncbi:MAG TPA: hypothetical protein VJR02_18150 [Pyrinomonadaceae bacterium]|nr:hypothetical protein [Pyrinomonadaceae bacterium]